MSLKRLGKSEIEITPIGLGTWAIGGDNMFGWGPQDDEQSIAAIRRAIDAGINWIDTAPIYGFGHAETTVTRALEGLDAGKRPLVFTKCSLVWDAMKNARHTLEAEAIRKDVEGSLKRLKTETLDLCQIHWAAFPPGGPDRGLEEAWTTLAELKQQGKIRYIGVSNFNVAQLERVRKIAPVTSLQPPYSMLMRQIEDDVLPYCERHDIGVIVYSPMHNGLLSGKMTRERITTLPKSDWRINFNPAFKEPRLTRNLEFVEVLRGIGERHERSVAEVAIAWTMRHPAVTAAIVGARRADQVDGFIGAIDFRLSADEISEIEAGLPGSVDMMKLA